MGERAGNADLVEIALALEALYGIPTRLRLDHARTLSALVQELSGTPLRAERRRFEQGADRALGIVRQQVDVGEPMQAHRVDLRVAVIERRDCLQRERGGGR